MSENEEQFVATADYTRAKKVSSKILIDAVWYLYPRPTSIQTMCSKTATYHSEPTQSIAEKPAAFRTTRVTAFKEFQNLIASFFVSSFI